MAGHLIKLLARHERTALPRSSPLCSCVSAIATAKLCRPRAEVQLLPEASHVAFAVPDNNLAHQSRVAFASERLQSSSGWLCMR